MSRGKSSINAFLDDYAFTIQAFISLNKATFDEKWLSTAEKLLNSGIIDPPGILQQIPQNDYNNILTFTEEIINDTINSSKKANQIQIYKFISKLTSSRNIFNF